MFEPNLGATEAQLQSLHEFAQNYLKQKTEREETEAKSLDAMRDELKTVGEPFKKLWVSLKQDEKKSVPAEEGRFLVVEKSFDRLRMAVTTNEQKELGGYLPKFDDISDWQEVTVDGYGKEPVIRTIYHWDQKQLDTYKNDQSSYWGLSTQIRVGEFDRQPADVIVQSYEDASRIMNVPDTLLNPKQ